MNSLLKKALTITLSITMLLSTLTFGTATVAVAEGYVEKEIVATENYTGLTETDGVYSVGTEAEWAALVAMNSDFAGKTVVLTADITFTSANGTIATFAGKLDGNAHTLKGVTKPLINTLNGGATIQNLIVEDANVVEPTIEKLGLIANVVNVTANIAFTDIAVKNAVVSNETSSIDKDNTCAGGMIGRIDSGSATITFTNCTVSGRVSAKQYAAGFAGIGSTNTTTAVLENCKNSAILAVAANPAYNVYVGGFFGYSKFKELTFTDCENTGDVNISVNIATNQDIYAGGFVGRNRGAVVVTNGRNTGDISVTSTQSRNAYIGGFAGHTDTTSASFSACVNYGKMENLQGSVATEYVGGIVGYISVAATVTACANYGDIFANNACANKSNVSYSGCAGGITAFITTADVKIDASYNMGTVYSKNGSAGGIVGEAFRVTTITNCVNTGDVYSCANIETNEYLTAGTVIVPTAGGILGNAVHANAKNSSITNCINTGKVMAAGNAAGILGNVMLDTVTGITVTDCSNSGAILSAGSTGGIIGNTAAAVTVSACYATGDYISTGANLGAIAGNAANVTVADSYASVTLNDVYTAWEGAAKSEKTEAEMLSELAVLNIDAQKSAVVDGKFNVVVLAAMNKLTGLSKVGFDVVRVVDGQANKLAPESTMVYTDVYGYDADGAQKVVNATDYANTSYLSALKITNVDTTENVTYLYRAFAVRMVEGEEVVVYGTWSAVSFAAAEA